MIQDSVYCIQYEKTNLKKTPAGDEMEKKRKRRCRLHRDGTKVGRRPRAVWHNERYCTFLALWQWLSGGCVAITIPEIM